MTSQKQIEANRANAKRSTGPRTAAGKMKSSRNAFWHGLSVPLVLDPLTASKVEEIARKLMPPDATKEELDWAFTLAGTQVQLLRIREIRSEILSRVDLGRVDVEVLQMLVPLDRYERYARTTERRASSQFFNDRRREQDDVFAKTNPI